MRNNLVLKNIYTYWPPVKIFSSIDLIPIERMSEENKLLKAFLEKDEDTILYMYKKYLPEISKYVCTNGGTHDDARDVFQEALMVLYKQGQDSKFELTASIKTYVFSICRYQWLKNLQKNKKIDSIKGALDLQDFNSNIISQLEKAEQFLILQDHISKFKGNNRKILELHLQKYSTNEIAKQLGLSRLYVRKKKYECKKQLIKSIKSDPRYKEIKKK